ncbi:MAG: hypothetical protein VYD33_04645, partial [Bacteroidota bacterium]|nr:hypothetical protein [Bacteroidota bacterium]
MNHNFKTGDRVLFINENDKGTILMFIGNTKVKLLNSAGFEEMVALNEIMSFPSDTNDVDSYGSFYPTEDNLEDLQQPKMNKFLQFSNDKISQLIFKADLHIENLV